MNFRRLLFGILIGATVYSLLNLLIDIPFSTMFSFFAIISGIILIFVLFIDIHHSEAKIASNMGVILIIYWVMSFFSVVAGYSSIYLELVRQNPDSFAGITDAISAIYFSFGTFATVGYGDIYPISPIAKFIVMSQIFVAIIVLPMAIGTSVNHRIIQKRKEIAPEFNKGKQSQLLRIK